MSDRHPQTEWIKDLLAAGKSCREVAKITGLSEKRIYRRFNEWRETLEPEESDVIPSPEEIRRRAAQIRKGWSSKETLRRRGLDKPPRAWEPPVVRVTEMSR